jgi:hypothetical protein
MISELIEFIVYYKEDDMINSTEKEKEKDDKK